ncbi:type III PLP-dependent enzyme [Amylibacter sp. SFDW26]|uniref:type III PLP-dependent enzyme n=1 Tax=Amylibacter sp. SFDW26 TaxID=2652722 RepID=UPI0012613EB2|nr:type III PLP-dependent enzyme [Amylibacter sp. SFDW26]KAB7616189.1 type III PLP-dependent enzyme [Amylibacter sp. SFDW26]
MSFQEAIWQTRRGYLKQCQPDIPVLFFNPNKLTGTAKIFHDHFPGLVTYAVKANPDPNVIKTLISCGITSFDVASPVEIDLIRNIAPNATLHYHNPVRSIAEIKHAVSKNIRCYSVDRIAELDKLLKYVPAGAEISVRLKLDLEGAAYDFGSKFGAKPGDCIALLERLKNSNYRTSMTFHPGTQCTDPKAWELYIKTCADIAKKAGCVLERLNVGGGFPSFRAKNKPDLMAFFETIGTAVANHFDNSIPKLVCEPGRSLSADGYSLATRVKALDKKTIFLNDGVYAGLTEFRDIGPVDRYQTIASDGTPKTGAKAKYTVFGPTCDSLDQLPEPLPLPSTIAEGDYILFENMGAYVKSITTQFNGYGNFKEIMISNTAP